MTRNDPPPETTPEAMKAAMEKEKTVTAWISLDVEELRTKDPRTIAETVIVAGNMIQGNLVTELAKNGIHVSRQELRRLRRG